MHKLESDIQPEVASQEQEIQVYHRFDLSQRIEHFVFLLSFSLLGFTGLPQKFPTSPISQAIVNLLGGIEQTRLIHHFSAGVMMVVSVYHVLMLIYKIYVLRTPLSMFPLIQDFIHLYEDILFYFGKRKRKAFYGRYNYAEKVEYLAVVWGTVIMGITGFMMWNPIATTRILPGEAVPAAKAAHGAEAILAVLAIIIWHFYHVHIRHFNKSIFTGKLTQHEMLEEHPAELAQIKSGAGWQRPSQEIIKKRQKVYYPFAGVTSLLAVIGIFWFMGFEQTAITTVVPRGETGEIFVPLTPTPRPTPAPTPTPQLAEGISLESWDGKYSALFRNRCSSCHGITSVGGLSLSSYEAALSGGNSGPAIIPGDPDASQIVLFQTAGDHPGQLSQEELLAVIQWIEAGAPER
jgi:cytochrome b subunit of formate dehydrogenase